LDVTKSVADMKKPEISTKLWMENPKQKHLGGDG
jgi:hypothetical protein